MSQRAGFPVGGDADLPALERCTERLDGYGIERGLKVIICAAGMSGAGGEAGGIGGF